MVDLVVNNEKIKNIELVIFDKDGTLMDLYMYWSNMIDLRASLVQNELGLTEDQKKDIMYEMGVDLKNRKLRPEGPVGLKKREVVMQAMVGALQRNGFSGKEDLCHRAFKEVDKISIDHLPRIIRPIQGMKALIEALKNKRCKIAIATTDKTERAKLAMRFLGIQDKIDMVVGEDMVTSYKPSPDMVNLILEELSIKKENAVMVGDALTDVEMGNNANLAASIGVCSGLTSEENLMKKTKYIVRDISEIKLG